MARAKKAPVVKSVIIEGAPVIERAIVRFSHIVLQFTVENGNQISYEVLETPVNPEVADAIEYATVRFSEVVCQFVVTDGTTVHAYELEPVYQEIGGGPTPTEPLYELSTPTTFVNSNDSIDTGVKIFDEERDYTILCEYTLHGTNDNASIFNCIVNADAKTGVNLVQIGLAMYMRSNGKQANPATSYSARDRLQRVAVRHVKDDTFTSWQWYNTNANLSAVYTVGNIVNGTSNNNCIIGSKIDGTINVFKIYDTVLSQEEVESFLTGE